MKKSKENRGITLITVIIAIIIMGILVTVSIYSGVESYRNAKVTQFVTQMQLIQAKVDELVNTNEYSNLGSSAATYQNILTIAYNQEEISTSDVQNFKYFSIDDLKDDMDLENIDTDVLINFTTREIVSIDGVEYKGKTYYTQYKLPQGQELIDYTGMQRQSINFVVKKELNGLNCLVKITNTSPNAKLLYVEQIYNENTSELENSGDWQTISKYTRTGEEYSVNISKSGIYLFRLQDNENQNINEDRQLEIIVTNSPKTNMDLAGNYDYSLGIAKWQYTKNYIWIPRFAYNKDDSSQIKYIKGNSNIATDNSYLDSQNWVVPNSFTKNNQELTGIWIRKSNLDEAMEQESAQIEHMEKDIQKIQYILENTNIEGITSIKGTEHLETEKPFEVIEETEFNGTSDYLRTDVALFSQENISKNFIIELNINSIGVNTFSSNVKEIPTLLGAMDENSSTNLKNGEKYYPGFNIKLEKDNGLKIETNSYTLGKKEVYIPEETRNIRILRMNNKLYYSFDEANFVMINDYSDWQTHITPFDAPVTFGAGLDAANRPRRFFNGIIEDVSIRFIIDEATIDDYNSTDYDEEEEIDIPRLKTIYAYEGSIEFTNTDNQGTPGYYIDTGLSMFKDEASLDKDFEISFVIEEVAEGNVNQAVIVNAKFEREDKQNSSKSWPGFVYRVVSTTLKLDAKSATGSVDSRNISAVVGHKVTISRKNRIVYIKIDGVLEEKAVWNFTNFTNYFDVNITIGASLDNDNGNTNKPFRGFKGTLSHILVRAED